jgi:hypothetical protein
MTEREMFEKSFMRPRNYSYLSAQEQWDIDSALGILDWQGTELSTDDVMRYLAHYEASND